MDIDETNALSSSATAKEKTSPVVVNQLKPLIAMASRSEKIYFLNDFYSFNLFYRVILELVDIYLNCSFS